MSLKKRFFMIFSYCSSYEDLKKEMEQMKSEVRRKEEKIKELEQTLRVMVRLR